MYNKVFFQTETQFSRLKLNPTDHCPEMTQKIYIYYYGTVKFTVMSLVRHVLHSLNKNDILFVIPSNLYGKNKIRNKKCKKIKEHNINIWKNSFINHS